MYVADGIPADLEFATKPQLAMRQLERLADAALDLQGGMMALVAARNWVFKGWQPGQLTT
jgi:hypothetical protein